MYVLKKYVVASAGMEEGLQMVENESLKPCLYNL